MSARLTSGHTLARSALWNLLGQGLPLVAALVSIPVLVRHLGVERFGVLSLVWMLIGYFSLFDLGLGWALTRAVSERLAHGRHEDVPSVVWTSIALLLAFGVAGTVVVAACAPWLVHSILHISPELQGEALGAFQVLAFTLPLVTGTAALTGLLSAQQRFGALNAIRAPMSAFSFLGPLLVLPFSSHLVPVALVLAFGRLVGWAAQFAVCLRVTPGLRGRVGIRRELVRPLLTFGGWMTVSAMVSPFLVYIDRFLIGAMLSMAVVAYYTTPYDLATRLWVLSMPLLGVLFPAFAESFALGSDRAARLFDWGLRAAFVLLFPGTLLLATFAHQGLQWWLGPAFASASAPVLRLLAVGVFVNGLAQVALTLVQGAGRPDLSARLHLIELPFYLGGVWLLIRAHGIRGAALAWVLRVAVDAAVLFVLSHRLLRAPRQATVRAISGAAAGVAILVAGAWLPGTTAKLAFVAVVAVAFGLGTWRLVVRPGRAVFERVLLSALRGGA